MNEEMFFGKSDEKWDWENFKSTKGFPVSPNLIDWIIGQERAMIETRLCIDEWINKILWLEKNKWWKEFEDQTGNKQLRNTPPSGPFVFLAGDAGTGKSLLGRALSSHMAQCYEKNGIILYDVMSWKNKTNSSEPKISIHSTPNGKQVLYKMTHVEQKKGFWKKWGMRIFSGFMAGMGILILGLGFYFTWLLMQEGIPFQYALSPYITYMVAGGGMIFSGIFINIMSKMFGMIGGTTQGIGGASSSNTPKLLIDNSNGKVPFIDATGHGSSQLFGSIAWDPYQTGGLGTPEHQRVTAGDVHRSHLGVLYIDEIKNLTGAEAITLLTVLEDGQLPIALRSQTHGGDTAAMAVSTEPIPCMIFLIAAGNLDSLPNIHPALLDRIQGYGKIIYMNNDMPNTVENRRKIVQFISQEVKRFNLLPFEREACEEITNEFRRKSGKSTTLTTKFRPMISIIKTASTLASNEGLSIVSKKHVDEAMNEHCKNIGVQILERKIEEVKQYYITPSLAEPKKGQIFGLAVTEINGDMRMGSVLPVRASMIKCKRNEYDGYFHITGVKTDEGSWIQSSISKVKHVFRQLYGIDLKRYKTHIDFAQNIGVDGPSAGVTMTLALISEYKNKKIRQDVAVTGEINIGIDGKIEITPIGGVNEKIIAAQKVGMSKVCIPKKNFEINVKTSDYTIQIVSCETLEDYIREILVE